MSIHSTRACIKLKEEAMEYHTLQDFMTFTKGSGYVMMLIILVCFIPFWLYLTDRERKD